MNIVKYLSNIAKYLPYLALIEEIDAAVKSAKKGEIFKVSVPVKVSGKALSISVAGTPVE